MFCHKCGKQNPDSAVVCSNCGTRLRNSAPVNQGQNNVPSSPKNFSPSPSEPHLINQSASKIGTAKKIVAVIGVLELLFGSFLGFAAYKVLPPLMGDKVNTESSSPETSYASTSDSGSWSDEFVIEDDYDYEYAEVLDVIKGFYNAIYLNYDAEESLKYVLDEVFDDEYSREDVLRELGEMCEVFKKEFSGNFQFAVKDVLRIEDVEEYDPQFNNSVLCDSFHISGKLLDSKVVTVKFVAMLNEEPYVKINEELLLNIDGSWKIAIPFGLGAAERDDSDSPKFTAESYIEHYLEGDGSYIYENSFPKKYIEAEARKGNHTLIELAEKYADEFWSKKEKLLNNYGRYTVDAESYDPVKLSGNNFEELKSRLKSEYGLNIEEAYTVTVKYSVTANKTNKTIKSGTTSVSVIKVDSKYYAFDEDHFRDIF